MDEIRQRVAARMKEKGISANALSGRLQRGSTYIAEWLSEKKDKIPYEMKLAIAEELDMDPVDLGVSIVDTRPLGVHGGGLSEDAEAYQPSAASPLSRVPHIAYFRMRSRALDQFESPILPNDLLAFDLNAVDPVAGKVVVAQCYDKRELTRSLGTIIRVFMAPNKLVTNSSGENEILRIGDTSLPYEIVIKGTMSYHVREVN